MKIFNKHIFILLLIPLFIINSCKDNFLNVLPEDVITSETFWESEEDVVLALNGVYNGLRDYYIYGNGPGFDAYSPNAYQWNGANKLVGSGDITAGTGGVITGLWTSGYNLISRANYFIENIDRVEGLDSDTKARYVAEAYFLRGIAFSLLAEAYGGVPLITSVIDVNEARELSRASLEETWSQAISDFDIAIDGLPINVSQQGRATVGAALGMKMRAYLYQNKYPEVLAVAEEIEELNKYELFPSYEGLFRVENENNQEVLFDVQNISGIPDQGGGSGHTFHIPGFGTPTGGHATPTPDLVNAYEMADGSEVDPNNPYEGRDPRLGFTVILPETPIGNYIFNADVENFARVHVGQPLKDYAMRKLIEGMLVGGEWPQTGQAELNYIIIRYADVLLAKAEALIETNQEIDEAIALINRIRTEREDVTITELPSGLSQSEARDVLRHERRIEFALEGRYYWSDIKRWEIGPDIYPMEIRGSDGGLVETRFAGGYQLPKDKYFPIPDNEIALNPNLDQNEGW